MSFKVIGLFSLGVGLAVVGGCAMHTPVSGHFPNISPRDAQSGSYNGRRVRWGGSIIIASPKKNRTCFKVMAIPLSKDGRPHVDNGAREDNGRFIACAAGFYDPFLYSKGREVTFVGTIEGIKTETIGQYRYSYPLLDATIVYLWPKRTPRPAVDTFYSYPIWGPWGWWGGYPGWWGFTGGLTAPIPPVNYRDPHQINYPAERGPIRNERILKGPTRIRSAPPERSQKLVKPVAKPGLNEQIKGRLLRARPRKASPGQHPAQAQKNLRRPRVHQLI